MTWADPEVVRRPEWRRKQTAYIHRHDYGLENDAFEALLIESCGRCGICGSAFRKKREPHIDRCHSTGKIRGLLCFKCNSALERLDSCPGWVDNAARYLADNLK